MADPFKDIQPISPRPKGASIGLTEPDAGAGGPSRVVGPPKYQQFVAQKAASKPASQFALSKGQPMYEIWSKRQNKMVGTATSLKSASRVIDRRDNEYGAYDHYKKKIGRD